MLEFVIGYGLRAAIGTLKRAIYRVPLLGVTSRYVSARANGGEWDDLTT